MLPKCISIIGNRQVDGIYGENSLITCLACISCSLSHVQMEEPRTIMATRQSAISFSSVARLS